jgi:type IV pilus assembly protein PilW
MNGAADTRASHPARRRRAQRGMTLVELMVALLLGLVTTYFIAQVFAVAEGQKRTATFGSDAQVNGAVALHTLKRHLQNSGYGLVSAVETLGCEIKGEYGPAGSTTPVPPMKMSPLVIVPGATASAPSDNIGVLASTKTEFAVPNRVAVISQPASGQNYIRVDQSVGTKMGDVMMTVPHDWEGASLPCTLFTVAGDNSTPEATLSSRYIPLQSSGSASSFNNASPSVWPAAGIRPDDWVVNFGAIRWMVFGVGGDNFQVVTWTPEGIGNAEQLQSGVVLLKALYGRDTNNDKTVDTYNTTAPANSAEWRQVLTVRLVVVARSGQREKEIVTAAEPIWNVGSNVNVSYVGVPGTPATVCAAGAANCTVTLPLSHVSDWQYYRYKVFDTVVPLRNMLWNLGT